MTNGQFDDLESAAWRAIADDPPEERQETKKQGRAAPRGPWMASSLTLLATTIRRKGARAD